MAYAEFPHIETDIGPTGTGTPYKLGMVNAIAGQLIAAGWDVDLKPDVVESGEDEGYQFWRTSAPVILRLVTAAELIVFVFLHHLQVTYVTACLFGVYLEQGLLLTLAGTQTALEMEVVSFVNVA